MRSLEWSGVSGVDSPGPPQRYRSQRRSTFNLTVIDREGNIFGIYRSTYYLTCDASDIAVSFNLSQIIDGTARVIEFGARGLRAAELSYTVSEKEVLAVVCGVQHVVHISRDWPWRNFR